LGSRAIELQNPYQRQYRFESEGAATMGFEQLAGTVESETLTLENMVGQSQAALMKIYQEAPETDTLEGLSGDPITRGLALNGYESWPLSIWKRYLEDRSTQPGFLFVGKCFRPATRRSGSGFNRIQLFGMREVLPFRLDLGVSLIDRRQCARIDYDIDENWRALRPLYDELRRVSPTTYMGPMCYRRNKGYNLLGWFGVMAANS
jgi:hypothetical protein